MKKIISLGIASAVCAIVAVSASADAVVAYEFKGELTNASDITIVVKATGDVKSILGTIETTGLEVKEVVANANAQLNQYVPETGKIGIGSLTGNLAIMGETVCEIKATVTAKAGEKISFFIKGNSDKDAANLPAAALTAEVKGATTSSDNSNSSNSGTSSTTPDTKPGTGNENAGTGVALAVVPAVLAAAGVIVAKKRK